MRLASPFLLRTTQPPLLDPGGLEVLDADFESFSAALTSASHTLQRALTDQRLFSGIGNAYPDEILHRARLSRVLNRFGEQW